VKTHLGSACADAIIFCADKLNKNLTSHYWNYYYAQTFLAVSEPLSDHEVNAMFPEQPLQCWDSDLIYSYWRLTGSKRILLGGGSLWTTYAKNDTWNSDVIDRVIHNFRKLWPVVNHVEFIQFWSGRIDMTRDLLPTVLRDNRTPWVHYVLGCVGLPWATFCGDFVARHVYDDESCDDHRYYRYFGIDRGFLIPLWVERVIGKRLVFVVNNAWAKYYQKNKEG
jgi:gamma-glutamylputrescine oxidase